MWEEHATSFTAWIAGVAARASMQPSGLWRSLKAGRIYLELAESSNLDDMDDLDVTAESLELMDKIARHAPAKVSKDVVRRTLDGELRVQELRKTWSTYRPASGGITARGRLPKDPSKRSEALEARTKRWQAEKRKPAVKQALAESEVLAAMQDFEWLGKYDQATRELDVTLGDVQLDSVVAVRRSSEASSTLELHAVQIQGAASSLTSCVDTAVKNSGCDYVWLAVPAKLEADALLLSSRVGVLALRQRGLAIVRPPKRQRLDPGLRLALLEVLLAQAYHWPAVQASEG